MPERQTALTKGETKELRGCEAVIARGLKTFYDVGTALLTIRDQHLYRATHYTFAGYCRERWRMGHSHAQRMIAAAKVVENLSPIGDAVKPTHESQVRPLAPLEPEEQRVVWSQAVAESSGQQPTAAKVEDVVESYAQEKSGLSAHPVKARARVQWISKPQQAHDRIRKYLPMLTDRERKVLAPYLRLLFIADHPAAQLVHDLVRDLRKRVKKRLHSLRTYEHNRHRNPEDVDRETAIGLLAWIDGELSKLLALIPEDSIPGDEVKTTRTRGPEAGGG
jgi:hypothetical protein